MSSLTDVFEELRERGYLAQMNFSCCQSCAGYEMTTNAVELIQSGKRTKESIKGCVFFHSQDNDDRRGKGEFHLSHGPMNSKEFGRIGLSDEEIGEEVCEVLKEHGIKFEWDGDPSTRILVSEWPPYPLEPLIEEGVKDD